MGRMWRRTHWAVLAFVALAPTVALAVIVPSKPAVPRAADVRTADEVAYRDGLAALVSRDLPRADQYFVTALTHNPRHVGGHLGRAEVAFQNGNLAAARKWIEAAIRIAPRDSYVLQSKARVQVLDRHYDQAVATLQAAAKAAPDRIDVKFDLAEIYMTALARPSDAVPIYRSIIEREPGQASALYALGVALSRTKQDAEARDVLARAAKLEPKSPLPRVELARLEGRQGRFREGLAQVDLALALTPKLFDARMVKVDLLLASGAGTEGLAQLRSLAADFPEDARVQFKLAQIEHGAGQIDRARAAYARTVEIEPKHADALNNLAWLEFERGADKAGAESLARRAVAVRSQDGQLLDTLAWILRGNGKRDEALRHARAAARLAPNDPTIAYHEGVMLAEAGQKAEARASLERALKLSKNFADARDAEKRLATLR